ncbi:unnamed protein product [Sphacelaria rigidula]
MRPLNNSTCTTRIFTWSRHAQVAPPLCQCTATTWVLGRNAARATCHVMECLVTSKTSQRNTQCGATRSLISAKEGKWRPWTSVPRRAVSDCKGTTR